MRGACSRGPRSSTTCGTTTSAVTRACSRPTSATCGARSTASIHRWCRRSAASVTCSARPEANAMTRSLSGRLLLAIVALVGVLLFASGIATYLVLQHFLLDRVDTDLVNGHVAAISVLGGRGPEGAENNVEFPIGTVLELHRPDGTEIGTPLRYDFPNSTSRAVPLAPHVLPAASEAHPALITLDGTGGVSHYRAAIWPEDSLGGNYILLAIPMDDVYATLNQLLLVEGLVGLAVLVATGVLALAITRIGLRPLDRMRVVAQEIAAGD